MTNKEIEDLIKRQNINGVFNGSIFLNNREDIPNLSHISITGNYYCVYNKTKSLSGLPKYIGGNFYIDKKTWDKLPKDTNEAIYLLLNDKVIFIEESTL